MRLHYVDPPPPVIILARSERAAAEDQTVPRKTRSGEASHDAVRERLGIPLGRRRGGSRPRRRPRGGGHDDGCGHGGVGQAAAGAPARRRTTRRATATAGASATAAVTRATAGLWVRLSRSRPQTSRPRLRLRRPTATATTTAAAAIAGAPAGPPWAGTTRTAPGTTAAPRPGRCPAGGSSRATSAPTGNEWPGPRNELYLPFLFMRANPGDLGARPVVGPFWESPDILLLAGVDPAAAPRVPPELGQTALAGQPNTIYAHVWNFGLAQAPNVVVEFYWCDPSLGIGPAEREPGSGRRWSRSAPGAAAGRTPS